MRCLSPDEVEAVFTNPRFTVSLKHAWYRSALLLDRALAAEQVRIAAQQPGNIESIPRFVRALNRWLPTNRARLLWIDHWETGAFGGFENAVIEAAWRGLGEARSLDAAPGLFLEAQDWDQEDQIEIGAAQAQASGLLDGLVAMLMMTESDGWLISSECADRIEFWEGHFFFHSRDEGQIRRANEIIDEFRCLRWDT
jgi:hypothetical protein